jgi:tripartite-type tricarboxylate transporter receptor subunit TctC
MGELVFSRRAVLKSVAGAAAAMGTHAWAQGPAWPQRTIRIVVPVAAGGIIDLLARAVAKALTAPLKTTLIVDSRPGADHLIGIQDVAHSDPDGYTWLFASIPFTVNPSMRRDPGYDAIKDFTPLQLIATSPNVLVVPAHVPAKDLKEFIALAKSKKGGLSYANPGNGSSNHLGMELFKSETGVDILAVPYKGQPPAITDLLAGRVQAMMMSTSLATGYISKGSLRPLAVVAAQRVPGMPDVPTMKECGFPGVDVIPWFGLLAPGKTPRAVVDRASTALHDALRSPALKADIVNIGANAYAPNSPAEFAKLIGEDTAKWPAILQRAGIDKV